MVCDFWDGRRNPNPLAKREKLKTSALLAINWRWACELTTAQTKFWHLFTLFNTTPRNSRPQPSWCSGTLRLELL
jgi:hypothetical protein